VPQGIIQLKEDEFWELTQDRRSVSEYVHKFTELARYAPDDVSTEVKKMGRFLKGLRPELKTILASQDFLSFSHLSNKYMQVERAKEEEKGHLKRKFQVLRSQQQDRHQKTRSFGFPPKGPSFSRPADPPCHGSVNRVRAPSMPPQLQATNTSECVLALRRSHSLQEQLSPAEAIGTGLLQLSEWPQEYLSIRPKVPSSISQQNKTQYQGRARVNHVDAQEAQQAPGVVLGEFLVEFTPAAVLFDLGSSHSFIATSFVEKHGIPSTPLEIPLVTRTPGSDLLC
jgi:hypothetical protein